MLDLMRMISEEVHVRHISRKRFTITTLREKLARVVMAQFGLGIIKVILEIALRYLLRSLKQDLKII